MDVKYLGAKERTLPTHGNRYEFERIYRLVADCYGALDKTALDYGCGSGYGTALLAAHFDKIIGIDVSAEAISFCGTTYQAPNLYFQVFDPQTQPFPDASFDGSTQICGVKTGLETNLS